MQVDQMIYTACGKDRTGAFSVWSKSEGVTKPECDEIMKIMSYRKPPNAPYEPTAQELKDLFPRKYGYFVLSSGRRCIAQTVYLGKVYSDLDERNGNFIIHAFIAKDFGAYNPFAIMLRNSFKAELTYAEWHDNPPPDALPQIELAAAPSFDEAAVRKYASDPNLPSLLQAIIEIADKSDVTVSFNAANGEEGKIYSVIGALLPQKVYSQATFCNQYSPQNDYAFSGMGVPMIKVRNIFESMIGSLYNYRTELEAGKYVFNFDANVCSTLAAGRYVNDIVGAVRSGESIFNILKRVESVNDLMVKFGLSADDAIAAYYAMQRKLVWFTGAEEYMRAHEIVMNNGLADAKMLAASLYSDIIATGRWGKGTAVAPIVSFAYKFGEQRVKDSVIESYFADLADYGVNASGDPAAMLAQVKSSAPFPWQDFAVTVARGRVWDAKLASASPNVAAYIVDAAACAVALKLGEAENAAGYKIVEKALTNAVARASGGELNLYINIASSYKLDTGWLYDRAFNKYISYSCTDERQLDFVFAAFCAVADERKKAEMLLKLVTLNLRTPGFMNVYVKYAAANKPTFDWVDRQISSQPEGAAFIAKKDAYMFRATRPTSESLKDYFEKYYKNGFDDGIFGEKVKEFIYSMPSVEKRIEAGVYITRLVWSLADDFADMRQVLTVVRDGMFNAPAGELEKCIGKYLKDLIELNKRVQGFGGTFASDGFCIAYTVLLTKGEVGNAEYTVNVVRDNKLYATLAPTALRKFTEENMDDIVKAYFLCKKSKTMDTFTLVANVFAKPFLGATGLAVNGSFEKWLDDNDGKESNTLFADLLSYALNTLPTDNLGLKLKSFFDGYIDSLTKGSAKKLLKKVSGLADDKYKASVQAYADTYKANNMGFFAKLFSKKK